MMTWGQLSLQDANSPVMEELIFLHDYINLILVFIISFICVLMFMMLMNTYINKMLLESQMIECIWTLIPALILIQIAMPSLLLLYMLDEAIDSSLTLKVMGHQWFWSYEYSDFWHFSNKTPLEFDSYMIPENELSKSMYRLLDVDNRVIVPISTHIRMLVSSTDVLHAWTVPSLGVKVDAVPGRLNQLKFLCQRPGLYSGQCSEICGANHSFMPIMMEVVNLEEFLYWLMFSQEE